VKRNGALAALGSFSGGDAFAATRKCGVERVAYVSAGPEHDDVADGGEAEGPADLVAEVAASNGAFMRDEQFTTQRWRIAPLLLPAHPAAELVAGDVATQVDVAHQPEVPVKRVGNDVLSAARVQLGDQQAVRPSRGPSRGVAVAFLLGLRRPAGWGQLLPALLDRGAASVGPVSCTDELRGQHGGATVERLAGQGAGGDQ